MKQQDNDWNAEFKAFPFETTETLPHAALRVGFVSYFPLAKEIQILILFVHITKPNWTLYSREPHISHTVEAFAASSKYPLDMLYHRSTTYGIYNTFNIVGCGIVNPSILVQWSYLSVESNKQGYRIHNGRTPQQILFLIKAGLIVDFCKAHIFLLDILLYHFNLASPSSGIKTTRGWWNSRKRNYMPSTCWKCHRVTLMYRIISSHFPWKVPMQTTETNKISMS